MPFIWVTRAIKPWKARYSHLYEINLIGASVIVTCLDWVGNEATGRITCLMDNEKIPIHGMNIIWLQPSVFKNVIITCNKKWNRKLNFNFPFSKRFYHHLLILRLQSSIKFIYNSHKYLLLHFGNICITKTLGWRYRKFRTNSRWCRILQQKSRWNCL